MQSTKYVLITAARDEGQFLAQTIESVLSQSIRPQAWVIVDDGSRDDTAAIAQRAAEKTNWISLIRRRDRGHRKAGAGVVESFYDGYGKVSENWDFLVKLDADLKFEPEYFARCFERFESRPELGIGGGAIYHSKSGQLILEKNPLFHVRGATKIYRKRCWEDIKGLFTAPGWDTIDEIKANMLGWKTETFVDLKVLHLRPTGAADGALRNLVKNGKANFICGYHPAYMLAKAIRRAIRRPFLLGSLALLYGYWSGYIRAEKKVPDSELIRYLRKQQIRRLLGRSSIWV